MTLDLALTAGLASIVVTYLIWQWWTGALADPASRDKEDA
jgi:hypothetical protein